MLRPRLKKVLLVAPETLLHQRTPGYDNIKHIYALNKIFPSINEQTPDLIVLDYNYLVNDIEKIVRRISTNPFYNKIKICCYKTKPNTKTDGLLKAIGVDYFIYQEDITATNQPKKAVSTITAALDSTLTNLLAGVSF